MYSKENTTMITKETHDILISKLDALINKIQNPFLSELCTYMVGNNGRYREAFEQAPAAKGMHHAYPGGLLEHSIEVAEFCISDCELLQSYRYESLDLDLLISAALLHDLAKTEEYELEEIVDDKAYYTFTYTGKIIGHLCLSAMWAYAAMDKINDFPKELKENLSHIILSHHGRVEWGTAILPKTKEAEFFHMADHRSATIAKGF